MTVKATANTGLAQNDVFYFGNAIGESGDNPANAYVNSSDDVGARQNPHTPVNRATVTDVYDYNRDSLVNSTDQVVPRTYATTPVTALKLITVPAVIATDDVAATDEDTPVSIAVLNNDRNVLGGVLSVYRVDAVSSLGASLTINPDKTIQYNPTVSAALQALQSGQSLWDTFTYTILDSRGLADTATVRVLVSAVSGLPSPPSGHGMVFADGGRGNTTSLPPLVPNVLKASPMPSMAVRGAALQSGAFDDSLGYLSLALRLQLARQWQPEVERERFVDSGSGFRVLTGSMVDYVGGR